MKRRNLLANMTSPYSSLDAWAYDTVVAPSVVSFLDDVDLELPATANGKLLDVGCGGGQVLAALACRYPSAHLTGLDLSADQVRRAKRRLRAASATAQLVEGSALAMPFRDGHFDLVISVASIKHWPDPAKGLAECVRVTRPGGRLVVVEADRGCHLDDAKAFVRRWRLPRVMRPAALAMFRTWVAGQSMDLEEVRALASTLVLSDVRVERLGGAPAWVMDATM